MNKQKTVLVITPTTGVPELKETVESVLLQTYPTDHLVVVDGPAFVNQADVALANIKDSRMHRLDLPFNTGANGYYGHRIMAGFSYLINHDYVMFLDHDNWIDNDHVESLVDLCETQNLQWAYSLRKICSKDRQFICNDDCESLGKWPVSVWPGNYLVDTSAYFFRQDFFRLTAHVWDFQRGADRRYFLTVKDLPYKYECSGKHSLNYRLGGNDVSVTADFFIEGNKKSAEMYGSSFPWSKK